MFRIWGRCIKDSRTVREITVSDGDYTKNRTRMVTDALTEICRAFDLAEPIWLDKNIREFQQRARTSFTADSFVEEIDFDRLELRVLEE